MFKLTKALKNIIRADGKNVTCRGNGLLFCENEFHKSLRLERERSDRSGLPFSILVFEISDSPENLADIQFMEKFLERRLRATDSLGWLDRNHMGITLFNTTTSGARVLARDIQEKLKTAGRKIPPTEVLLYPDQALKISPYSKDFHTSLKLERERSDRSGLPFTILIFELSKTEENQIDINLMKEFLLKRLRATDSLGWIDENNIGVIMFNAVDDGGKILANDIHETFLAADRKPPETKLFVYKERGLKAWTHGAFTEGIEQLNFMVNLASQKDP